MKDFFNNDTEETLHDIKKTYESLRGGILQLGGLLEEKIDLIKDKKLKKEIADLFKEYNETLNEEITYREKYEYNILLEDFKELIEGKIK